VLPRVLASLLCLLGAASAGLGVASATVWRPSDTLTASTSATGLLVTDPGVLDLAGDTVTITADGTGPVVIALGTTEDVDAWVGASRATHVTGLTSRTELATTGGTGTTTPSATTAGTGTTTASPSPTTPAGTATTSAAPTGESQSPTATPTSSPGTTTLPAETDDPTGSDLWVRQVTGDGKAELTWQRTDGRWSVLVAAPEGGLVDLTMSWPQTVTTPWLRPGVTAGVVLVVLGAAWWVLLLIKARNRSAGTRRVRPPSRRRAAPAAGTPASGSPEPVIAVARPVGRHSSHAAGAPVDEPMQPSTGRGHGRRAAPAAVPAADPVERPAIRPAALPVSVTPSTPEPPVDAPAPVDASAPASAEPVSAAPLTRRALREMREREARQRESDTGLTEPAPVADADATPVAVASGPTSQDAPDVAGTPGAQPAGPAEADRASAEPPWPAVPAAAAAKGRGARGGPLSRLRRRRTVEPEPWPIEPEPIEPVALPEPPPASGPSADAWRRAWGLPGATPEPGSGAGTDDQEEGR
jgi:hypothetical protein